MGSLHIRYSSDLILYRRRDHQASLCIENDVKAFCICESMNYEDTKHLFSFFFNLGEKNSEKVGEAVGDKNGIKGDRTSN